MHLRYCAIALLAALAVASCSSQHSSDRDYRPLGDPQAEKRNV
ncbi:type VI secretion protein [Pseudomonas matsuisoli]|uniref:Type VI secretion protein n=1 Tax=Pseudomonas matsuisoli TaxID=1515666 RepID=A0A917PRL8_9PSED|nr:type VI secretion protein [Pseudomonas matsuisoli]GGJ89219.1 hypothetical protein GCM10009304_13520 [Pseudomonas matsuisoli]